MAGKARVHELAKQLGVTSKDVLARLKEQGEFVKSASSTVEAPVARRLKESFVSEGGDAKADGAPKKAKPSGASSARASGGGGGSAKAAAPSGSSAPEDSGAQAPEPAAPEPAAPKPAAPKPAAPESEATSSAPKPGPKPGPPKPGPKPSAPAAEDGQGASARPDRQHAKPMQQHAKPVPPEKPASAADEGAAAPKPAPKPGPKPGPRQPKVGNNPYSTAPSPAPRPGPRSGGGQGGQGSRSQGNQGGRAPAGDDGSGPSPASMPKRPSPGAMPQRAPRPSGGRGRPGGGGKQAGGAPGGAPGGGGGGFRGRGRGGRGNTAGAFGRPGGAPRRGRKSKRQKRREYDMQAPKVGGVKLPRGRGEAVRLARGASLSDFADKIDANPATLVQALFNLGEMVTATQSVSDETLELLGSEMNYVVQVVSPEDEDRELLDSFDLSYGEDAGTEEDLASRPPVVTVMGHVDHGKTRLLDTIRKANVGEGEAGGITQHIGAYQVNTHLDDQDRVVTFIDTPGHEAFTAMRARGAQATDIAIIVVAADDGVMPQTVEAINHAQAAEVPIVVAVNKIDKEGADPAKIRGQMTEYGLVSEDYGGETMFVDISAKQGEHIDDLLEAVLLTADASLDLRANPSMDAQGVAIEAHLDRGRGPVSTVLVKRGTLRVGASIVAGDAYGRVRRMNDENGDDVTEAEPSRPVQVVGFTSVPGAGDNLLVVDEDRVARQIADKRNARKRNALAARGRKRISLEDLDSALKEHSQLNLIIKGDNSGTVEALEEALVGIEIDDEVELRVIDRGVGAVTETNVNLAAASDAVIIGFNVRSEGKATELANREGVDIRYYSVIYKAIDEIESALKGMLKPIYEEVDIGKAEIRAIFKSSKVGNIAGCMVTEGVVRRNGKARLVRDGAVVADSVTIQSLRREKDDANEVRDGFECGMVLSYSDIKEGDVIDTFELREKPRE